MRAIFFLLTLFTLFTGCASKQGEPPPGAPPPQLIFGSTDELNTFLAAETLNDEELDAFLRDNSYNMNSIASRSDLTAMCALLRSKPLPAVKGALMVELNVRVEEDIVSVLYCKPSGERYSFRYCFEESIEGQYDALCGPSDISTDWASIPYSRIDWELYEPAWTKDSDDPADPYLLVTPELILSLRMFDIDPDQITTYIDDISYSSLS